MAFVSTGLGAIGDFLGGAGDFFTDLLGAAAPIADAVSAVAPIFGGAVQSRPSQPPQFRPTGSAGGVGAMPGGAMIQTLPAMLPMGGGLSAQAGNFISGGTCIVPQQGGQRITLPSRVNVPHPTQSGQVVTYVRAPQVRYKVTISPKRRNCRGGR